MADGVNMDISQGSATTLSVGVTSHCMVSCMGDGLALAPNSSHTELVDAEIRAVVSMGGSMQSGGSSQGSRWFVHFPLTCCFPNKESSVGSAPSHWSLGGLCKSCEKPRNWYFGGFWGARRLRPRVI